MSTPINITVDGKSILDDLDNCEINHSEDAYCLTISLSLLSQRYWKNFSPNDKCGELRIAVYIGSDVYWFLVEDRKTNIDKGGVGFNVWGRSKQAFLDAPYAKTITDTMDSADEHPWQMQVSKASEIVAYVVANYCETAVTVTWNVLDFMVYQDTFSADRKTPLGVIRAVADVIGAQLVANIDGSLSIEEYSVEAETPVTDYDPLHEIVGMGETIQYPKGFNSVTIHGYEVDKIRDRTVSSYLSAIRLTSETIYLRHEFTVRVYYYHPEGNRPTAEVDEGKGSGGRRGTEQITESITLIWGKGTRSKPNTNGETQVESGSSSTPIEIVQETYDTYYIDFTIRATKAGERVVLFYFADQSAYTTLSFTAIDPNETVVGADDVEIATPCESCAIEVVSPETIVPGCQIIFIVFYANRYVINRIRPAFHAGGLDAHNSAGTAVTIYGELQRMRYTEEVTFSNGVANLSYPIFEDFVPPEVTSFTCEFRRGDERFHREHPVSKIEGSKTLVVPSFIGKASLASVQASVTYYTQYQKMKTSVPETWKSTYFDITVPMDHCDDPLELSLSVDEAEESATGAETATRNILIQVQNWATAESVEGAQVYVDGSLVGITDELGQIGIDQIEVGDHTLKITKSGYVDSDRDELANDSFTVTSS